MTKADRRGPTARARAGAARWIPGGTAALTVLLMAITSLNSVAAHHAFPSASWSASTTVSASGCASTFTGTPTWNPPNGVGHFEARAGANVCPATHRGTVIDSSASSSAQVTLLDPVSLGTGAGGVNATLSLKIAGYDAASWSFAPCPTHYSNFSFYNSTSGWINSTTAYAYCEVYAEVGVSALVALEDLSNGSVFYAQHPWAGVGDSSGTFVYNSTSTTTFSNPAYWSSNYTTNYSTNYSYGPGGSIGGSYREHYRIPGTFLASHGYALYMYVSGWTVVAVDDATLGHAKALVYAQGPSDRFTLDSVTTW